VLLKADENIFPLRLDVHTIGLIEFASHLESEVVEQGGQTGLAKLVHAAMPQVETISLKVVDTDEKMVKRAEHLAQESDVLIVATRNAHLLEAEITMAQFFIEKANNVILVCLKNPYDATVLDADTILCT